MIKEASLCWLLFFFSSLAWLPLSALPGIASPHGLCLMSISWSCAPLQPVPWFHRLAFAVFGAEGGWHWIRRGASEEIWSALSVLRQGPVDIFLPSAHEGPLPAQWTDKPGLWGIFLGLSYLPRCLYSASVCGSAPFRLVFICLLVPSIRFCLISFLLHNC